MEAQIFKAGLIQFDVCLGAIAKNLSLASQQINTLASQDVRLAVLPEMWSCGFDYDNLSEHAATTDAVLKEISGLAQKNNMVIAGSLPQGLDGKIYNTLFVIDHDGSVKGRYCKVHLFSPHQEDQYFTPGLTPGLSVTSLGTFGLLICYDLRFPELCCHAPGKGALFIILTAQWPWSRIRQWEVLIQARAIENQAFVLAVNRCGADQNIQYGGGSMIVSPTGEILACSGQKQALITASLDPQAALNFRKAIPCLHDRRPQVYGA